MKPADLRRDIPKGKTRVIYVDPFSHEDGVVKDCDSQQEAFDLADKHNKGRTDSMDDVHYVYDDTGAYLRGAEAVTEQTGGLGVSP